MPLIGSLVITLLIFMILPFTQIFSSMSRRLELIRPVEVAMPPPPPPKEPPPEEKKPEEKPEMKEKIKPLTLSQLELILNPGTGGALEGDFGLDFGLVPDTIEEMKIFELYEVDKEPQLVYEPMPLYPAKLYRDRVEGSVTIVFVVDERGNVTSPHVTRRSGYREFDDAALTAVSKYKFTPGIKDGQPVRVRYERTITFTPTR